MWVKSTLVVAVLCNTMALVSAWKIDDSCSGGKTYAYTMNWEVNGKNHAFIQLCNNLKDNPGMKLIQDKDGNFDAKKMNSALNFMAKLGKPIHIGLPTPPHCSTRYVPFLMLLEEMVPF
ncbi:hypothetical protein N7492_008155 [Penicillium capsulatum]|uniref:Chitinase n=1 Tax=Penicillium capsulatum TaxID=69766 RepID=A0A9W9LGT3_9EURO|nr:hypothetical protein N7492_008155 [Penicillium capsulatum]KAJ6105567.1 hypothetical protein N7512_009084 [Penicillium capsulatum]